MPIYTRKGDKGKTSLFDGKKIWKSAPKVEAYGTIDELNSAIGAASSFISNRLIQKELEQIQNDLFEISSSLAVSDTLPVDQLESRPEEFEKLIDKMTKQMPPLNQFILPGGSRGASLLHVARTVSRRAERNIVQLSQKEHVDKTILIYLNRLSDLLFTIARYVNFLEKKKDNFWKKR